MKKLLILALFVVVAVSCSKEPEVTTSPLVGTWEEKITTTASERFGIVFNSDNTGNFYYYDNKNVKSSGVNFTYDFYEKTMELSVMWINMPTWDNSLNDMIEIRNGNILIYRGDTYYKK